MWYCRQATFIEGKWCAACEETVFLNPGARGRTHTSLIPCFLYFSVTFNANGMREEKKNQRRHKRVIEDSDITVVTRTNRSKAVLLLLRCLQPCEDNPSGFGWSGRREELSQRGKSEPQTSHEESGSKGTCRLWAAHRDSSQAPPLCIELVSPKL